MPVNSFRDLRIWQSGVDLAKQIYDITQTFPKHEVYGLASQMQRAIVSVPSNIAEGHAREHLKEYLQHLAIARGSLAELETQLEIACRLGYVSQDQLAQTLALISSLGRQISALRTSLTRKPEP